MQVEKLVWLDKDAELGRKGNGGAPQLRSWMEGYRAESHLEPGKPGDGGFEASLCDVQLVLANWCLQTGSGDSPVKSNLALLTRKCLGVPVRLVAVLGIAILRLSW